MATFNQHLAARPSLFDGLNARFNALRSAVQHGLAQRAEANRVFAELAVMTDAELSDIGISRNSIRDIAREAGRMV
ncbi:DUF1127 domain-containing protein [Celeribacter neptunius]|uniref:YjiS-like domain-containing protein n=1 Tax=Celeribacter neptunius TaxID=588602 RepID=A0A1I3KGH6_9RHOB|nr:DUF1127 domain-containing protein [Celeribacter neptunius]SFI71504.1 protein of unknown function [Celeribacter neptunius]